MYPLILKPSYQHYVWGGSKILTYFQRKELFLSCAESWEVSDREEGMSEIQEGPYQGQSLREWLRQKKGERQKFPLLTKIIDAAQSLSIQVHPNEEGAAQFGGEAKAESWYVLDADPGSFIYLGWNQKISQKQLLQAIQDKDIERYLHRVEVKKGDVFYIPGGVVHSIGKGCLIYEVQQNSNTTYRLYDWDRKDSLGNARELHIQKALEVIDFEPYSEVSIGKNTWKSKKGFQKKELLQTPFFEESFLKIESSFLLEPLEVFRIWFVIEGSLTLQIEEKKEILRKGVSCMIPEKLEGIKVSPSYLGAKVIEVLLRSDHFSG